ncbi:DUF4271 domain-containing protein [Prevotella sp. A2931]|uniref:DUF4271 domain-containing protein n=1 Tax=Prevotella illustrans TaxID=2800387 RepID=A0ABS3M6H4_9BACT|nr:MULTISPECIES: DUF4271 domain-containing protein [Prevotella]MBO1363778.1 DUF4271 domain-containing protein [Prevotella illustrans]PTL26818.1 DUF4271 domain-containing protein [Prevotella sp. oral taxon 820]
MLQTDSIAMEQAEGEVQNLQPMAHRQPTPAQVLSWLPKNATPEQQDSAIQANFEPGEIHWSQRPDTLHLPGWPVGKSYRDVSLPRYYKESFFSNDSLFHPELTGGRLGVAGDPVPYTPANDNFVTGVLFGVFILALIALSRLGGFIKRQAKDFFYIPRNETSSQTETSGEIRFQLFLLLQTSLLLALIYFFSTFDMAADTFAVEPYQAIGIYGGMFTVYFFMKFMVYAFTNWVFFERRANRQWLQALLFIISVQGMLLFPIVMLQVYFSLSIKTVGIYTLTVIILFKLLSFYKTHIIFFRRKGAFLQNILYFCALEIVPLLSLYGALILTNSYLKINY